MNVLNVVVIGDKAVGKSAMVRSFMRQFHFDQHIATIGTDLYNTYYEYDERRKKMTRVAQGAFELKESKNERYHLKIYDTAGDTRFRAITNQYICKADIFIICFDRNAKGLTKWLDYIYERYDKFEVPILIVCTKMDCKNEDLKRLVLSDFHLDICRLYNQSFLLFNTQYNEKSEIDLLFETCIREHIMKMKNEKNVIFKTYEECEVAVKKCCFL